MTRLWVTTSEGSWPLHSSFGDSQAALAQYLNERIMGRSMLGSANFNPLAGFIFETESGKKIPGLAVLKVEERD